jgi:hypothetical protein
MQFASPFCLLLIMTGSLFAMQNDDASWSHPCLPRKVYCKVYADLVAGIKENPAIKQAVSEFVLSQLHISQEILNRGDVKNISCHEVAQMVSGMYLLGNDSEKALAIYSYGGMVNDFSMFALRKRLGMRADHQREIETWHLEPVTEEEFCQGVREVYATKQSFLKALLLEEICAHKVLCELAGLKYPIIKSKF